MRSCRVATSFPLSGSRGYVVILFTGILLSPVRGQPAQTRPAAETSGKSAAADNKAAPKLINLTSALWAAIDEANRWSDASLGVLPSQGVRAVRGARLGERLSLLSTLIHDTGFEVRAYVAVFSTKVAGMKLSDFSFSVKVDDRLIEAEHILRRNIREKKAGKDMVKIASEVLVLDRTELNKAASLDIACSGRDGKVLDRLKILLRWEDINGLEPKEINMYRKTPKEVMLRHAQVFFGKQARWVRLDGRQAQSLRASLRSFIIVCGLHSDVVRSCLQSVLKNDSKRLIMGERTARSLLRVSEMQLESPDPSKKVPGSEEGPGAGYRKQGGNRGRSPIDLTPPPQAVAPPPWAAATLTLRPRRERGQEEAPG